MPRGLKRRETAFGNLGHAERQRVHREIGVVLEQGLVVRGRHDAAHSEALTKQLHLFADGYVVARGEHAVDGHLVSCLGHAPLGVCGQIDRGAVLVDAQRAVAAVIALRVVEVGVEGPVTEDFGVSRAAIARRVGDSVQLLVGGLEGGGEAHVLDRVLLRHVVDDDGDGVRCQQKARRQRDGYGHQQEDAQVFPQVVFQLAREALAQRRCHGAPPTRSGRARPCARCSPCPRQAYRRAGAARGGPCA